MNDNKLVSIVIVNWNTKGDLFNCIQSLQENENKDKTEIIVVDNDSIDGSMELIQNNFKDVIWINSGGNIGFGKANNLAFEIIKSKYVLLLNPDTIVFKDSINKMVKSIEADNDIGAVGCKMLYPDGKVQPLGIQWFPTPFTELFSLIFITSNTINKLGWLIPYHDSDTSGCVKKLYGGCLLIRADLIRKIGGFDPRFFMYGEDVDLCIQLFNAGYKLFYLADAEVIHLCGRASRKAPNSFATIVKCESIYKLIEKYYGINGSFMYRIFNLIGASIRVFVALISFPIIILSKGWKSFVYGLLKHYYIVLWASGIRRSNVD